MTKLEAIKKLSSLESNLKLDYIETIGPSLFRQLSLIGLIKQGVGVDLKGMPVETCDLSDMGKKQLLFITTKPNQSEKEMGKFLAESGWTM